MKKGEKDGVGFKEYLVFLLGLLFFSGLFQKGPGPLKILDLQTYLGQFGTIVEGASPGILGSGGYGLKYMFLQSLTIAPGIFFAVAVVNVVDYYGGMKAAGKLLSPILGFLMGVPGESSLAIIANLETTDGSTAIVKELYENKKITSDQRDILSSYLFTGTAIIGMMVSYGIWFLPQLKYGQGAVFLVVIVMKFVSGNMMRLYLKFANKNNVSGEVK